MMLKVLAAGEGDAVNVLGNTVLFRAVANDTADALEIIESVSPPNGGVPPHVHSREDETAYVLEGRFEIRVEERLIQADSGTFVCLPRNVPHGFKNVGDAPGRVLFTIAPAGLCKMFTELSQLPAASPPEMRQVAAICDRYGVRFL
jgi:quercetin dioxygenase-like cupin family protein